MSYSSTAAATQAVLQPLAGQRQLAQVKSLKAEAAAPLLAAINAAEGSPLSAQELALLDPALAAPSKGTRACCSSRVPGNVARAWRTSAGLRLPSNQWLSHVCSSLCVDTPRCGGSGGDVRGAGACGEGEGRAARGGSECGGE